MLPPCKYRKVTESNVKGERRKCITCQIINDTIGWSCLIGGESTCQSCLSSQPPATLNTPIIKRLVSEILFLHISRWWSRRVRFDKRSWIGDNVDTSFNLLRRIAGDDMAGKALVQAVENGFPQPHAIALAETLFSKDVK